MLRTNADNNKSVETKRGATMVEVNSEGQVGTRRDWMLRTGNTQGTC